MKIAPFALERYFAEHEFSAKYLLSSSDCESLQMSDLLALADVETRRLWEDALGIHRVTRASAAPRRDR
jgi:hypothetical protein